MKKYSFVIGFMTSLLLVSPLSIVSAMEPPSADIRTEAPLVDRVINFDPENTLAIYAGFQEQLTSSTTVGQIDSILPAIAQVTSVSLEDLTTIEQAIQSFGDGNPISPHILADLYQLKGTITSLNLELSQLANLIKSRINVVAVSSTDTTGKQIDSLQQSIQKLLKSQRFLIHQIFNVHSYSAYESFIMAMQQRLAEQEVRRGQYRERVGEAAYRRTHGTREQRESVCPDHLLLGRAADRVIPDFNPRLFDKFNEPDVTTGERMPMATTTLNGKLWKVFALEKTTIPFISPGQVTNIIASRMGVGITDKRVYDYYTKHMNDSSRAGIIWKKVEDRSDDLGGSICVYQSVAKDAPSMQPHGYNPMNGAYGYYSNPTRNIVYTFALVPAEEGDAAIVRQDTIARQTHYAKRMHAMRQQGLGSYAVPYKDLPNLHKDSPEAYAGKLEAAQKRANMEMKERIARARVHALRSGVIDRESHEQIHASRVHRAGKMLHSPATALNAREIEFYGSDQFVDELPTSQQIHRYLHQPGVGSPVVARQTMTQAVNNRVAASLAGAPDFIGEGAAVYRARESSTYQRRVHNTMAQGATRYSTGTGTE